MGLRAEKKEETRQAILRTSLTLFRDHGFDATRVQDVTTRLRISEATFFNYFPTKDAVLEAAARDLLGGTVEFLRQDVTRQDRPVQERLEQLVHTFATHFAGDRELAGLLATHTRFFLGGQSEGLREVRQLLTALFEQDRGRTEVRIDVSAPQLAELFLGLTLATINGWLVGPDDGAPLEERLLAAHRVFWTGSCAQLQPGSAS